MKTSQNFVGSQQPIYQALMPQLDLMPFWNNISLSGHSNYSIPEEEEEDMDLPNPFPTVAIEEPDEEYPVTIPDETVIPDADEIIEPDQDVITTEDIEEVEITPEDLEIAEPIPGEIDIQEDDENEYPAPGAGGTQPDPEDLDAYPSSDYSRQRGHEKQSESPEMILDSSFPFHYLSLW
jgi:hypothetical protein